jgi:hypothetical protein
MLPDAGCAKRLAHLGGTQRLVAVVMWHSWGRGVVSQWGQEIRLSFFVA